MIIELIKYMFFEKRVLWVSLIWILGLQILNAQDDGLEVTQKTKTEFKEDTCHLILQASVKKDSIVLRWAPNLAIVWKQQLEVGYILERAEMSNDLSEKAIVFEQLTPTPILPLPYKEWAKVFKPTDKYAGIAAQLMFTNTAFSASDFGDPENITDRVNDLKMRHSFSLLAADQDARVAQASGLRFTDKTAKKGKSYLYRLYFASPHPEIPCDTAIIYIDTEELDVPIQIRTPLVSNLEQAITLQWNAGKNSTFSGYFVERADFGTDKFKRLNETPIVGLLKDDSPLDLAFFTDSVENYKKYLYRIIGINLFGESSIPSEIVEGMARDLTPPSPAQILKGVDLGNKTIRLEWIVPYVDPDLDGFEIARSANVDGPFQAISKRLSKEKRDYIDVSPDRYKGGFYAIFSYDTAGNASQSLPFYAILVDSFPPAVPTGLHGYVDTNSVVHLKWDLNKEPDLQGYRVFFANSPDDEFSNLTPYIWVDTLYNDTIEKRTLTKHIYYSIAAVDHSYNHSKMSPWVKIRRLDVIAPTPPIFNDVEVRDSSIYLAWFNSTSDDVLEHLLLRRVGGEKEWKTIAQWKGYPSETTYIDQNIAPKTFYEYALAAIDSSQLRSENSPLMSVRSFDSGRRIGIEEIKVKYDFEQKKNVISWDYSKSGNYSFLIYRSYQEFGLTKYVKVKGKERFYADEEITGKGKYAYAIKVIYEDGGESPLSEQVNVLID